MSYYEIHIVIYFYLSNEGKKSDRCTELMLDQENAGSEEILNAARKIMVEKKVYFITLFHHFNHLCSAFFSIPTLILKNHNFIFSSDKSLINKEKRKDWH